MIPFLDHILKAHGALARWESFQRVIVRLRFGGLAFAMRWNRKGTKLRTIVVSLQTPMAVFENYPGPGLQGVFTPDLVWIENRDGQKLKERAHPRAFMTSWRRQIWWDDLDLLYFAGYALWNYLNTPFLLAMKGLEMNALSPWQENGETWSRLRVQFPDHIPTHCKEQTFYFDRNYLLRRLDYDPELFAPWARAAHYCTDFRTVNGLVFPMCRKVLPRKPNGRSGTFPTLVWIDIQEIHVQ